VTAAAAKEEGALSEAFAHMMDGIHAIIIQMDDHT
jgi:hypothetical protein